MEHISQSRPDFGLGSLSERDWEGEGEGERGERETKKENERERERDAPALASEFSRNVRRRPPKFHIAYLLPGHYSSLLLDLNLVIILIFSSEFQYFYYSDTVNRHISL